MERKMKIEDIKTKMAKGIEARESGNYKDGGELLESAFAASLEAGDDKLAIETGNNYSIQCRLIAGRSARKENWKRADEYSEKSLSVYEKLESKGFLDPKDPNIARNKSHALLYGGRTDEAIPRLEESAELQENPAAKGDEYCHLSAALIVKGDFERAEKLLEEGVDLIENNNGSPIWLTFGLMTRATLLSKTQRSEKVRGILNRALEISRQKKLAVREEEINFLAKKDSSEVDVLAAVANQQK